jgi:cytochrome c5
VKRHWTLLLLAVGLWGAAVAGEPRQHRRASNAAPVLDEAAAQNAGLDPSTAATARKVYTTKCMRCHKSYDPTAYSQPQWEAWMAKMRKKAHLSREQDGLVSRYLDACRSSMPLAKTNLSDLQLRGATDER